MALLAFFIWLACLVAEASPHDAGSPAMVSWERGSLRVTLSVRVLGPALSYNISVAGRLWLASSTVARFQHCGGRWAAPPETLVATARSSRDALGAFDALAVSSGRDRASSVREFRYYSRTGVFKFVTVFPGGCENASLAQPHSGDPDNPPAAGLPGPPNTLELNASRWPSSEFPSFDARAGSALGDALGWVTWAGRFMHDGAANGVRGLRHPGVGSGGEPVSFLGGSTGGPLVLFDPQLPQLDALVLSPADQFMSAILAKPAQTEGAERLVAGVQGRVRVLPPGSCAGCVGTQGGRRTA